MIFIVSGMLLAKQPIPSLGTSIAICALGAVLQLSEAAMLDINHIAPFYHNDFLLGTLPYGVGAFLIARNTEISGAFVEKLAGLGRYSLGIYAIHLLFVWAAAAIVNPNNLVQNLLVALIALSCSCAVTILIGQSRQLRFLVA
jgi:surface polysaccharide O-acyltransferase-like enzyme